MAHTYQRLVRYTETTVRYATSLDTPWDDSESSLYDSTPDVATAEDSLDNDHNELLAERKLTAQGMSVSVAWLSLLKQKKGRMCYVARHLKLSLSHTYRTYQKVRTLAQQQTPLPLETGGLPHEAIRPWRKFRQYRAPTQLAFEFDSGFAF
ncbi:hypothetical protein [uncultured Gilvimarinus sp.]|uniref:hypothetical protein n=1 Tax=uncultured Gilvimarinus sp. TaxID=1689143 RepID=UPI0030D87B8C